MIGQSLSHFKITAKLGEGGMGVVYQATDTKLDREVAIKVLPEVFTSSPDRLARFEREARVLASLNHAHIAAIYEVGEQAGVHFLVMELVAGETLDKRLEQGSIPLEETLRLALQVASGLEAAHEQGVVHRDLKPANIKIAPDGRVKILDFGLAKQTPAGSDLATELTTMSRLTQQGGVIGTVPYMSPEQAGGRSVDHFSDQFSFGVVLYEMLCGKRPFQGTSMATVLSAILRDDPPPPGSLRPQTPGPVARVVLRCLEKDPEKRYPSTADLGLALQRCRKGLSGGRWGLTLGRREIAAGLSLIAIAGAAAAWLWLRADLVRWLEREALTESTRLADSGELFEAFRLARGVLEKIPQDPEVGDLLNRVTIPVSIVTQPPGAEVHVKAYAVPDSPWVHLGKTPLTGARVPYALAHWKISQEGFETFEGAPYGIRPFMAFAQGFTLDREGSRPKGMIRAPGGPYQRLGFPPVELADYWLDRFEVTRREFKEFVDAGGYENEEYWIEPFVEGGRQLQRDDAIGRLVDATGHAGPADWEFGAYGEGEADLPVGGVSWYEAAAYCRFVGKSLPTVFHWSAAAVQDQLSDIVRVSNFGGNGPAPVGSYPGLGDFGTYDMAGNVKEWCWNESASGRYILGGAWGEPSYTFRPDTESRPALSREPQHGFRCARYSGPLDEALLTPVRGWHQVGGAEPVSAEVFEAYRRMYAYDRSDLKAAIESVDEGSPYWRRETVSFEAAYGDERVLAHLFLPRNAEPPYQPVIWFPGNDVFFLTAADGLASSYLFDFIPRSGRALVYPVYKGTYERHVSFTFEPNEWRDMIVLWSKDLSRSVDYLETRSDIDTEKLGYYGFSAGAFYGPIFTAIDERFKASVLLAGGLLWGFQPEVDALNFASRSHVPAIMINGKDDFLNPLEVSQKPLFQLLGAPPDQKRHARLEGGHIIPDRRVLIEEVLGWLDRFLGPVPESEGN